MNLDIVRRPSVHNRNRIFIISKNQWLRAHHGTTSKQQQAVVVSGQICH
jgi:hypothetical protein